MASNSIAETFYTEFTSRAEGFIDPITQQALRDSLILIAGLGSVGGPIALALLKAGAENLILADPDNVEISNLSRQPYFHDQIGQNKAFALSANLLRINPFAKIHTIPQGITNENLVPLVSQANMVIDAIDLQALDIVYGTHQAAAKLGKPTFVGYDLGSAAILRYYPYDTHPAMKPLNGEITEEDIHIFSETRDACLNGSIAIGTFVALLYSLMPKLIELDDVPIGQLREALNREHDNPTIYQDSPTPLALSALAVTAVRSKLAGEPVKKAMRIDLQTAVGGETEEEAHERMSLATQLRTILDQTYISIANHL